MSSSICSNKKVLLATYVPRPHDQSIRATRSASQTACIVVERNIADQISIQGYEPVAFRDKHKCWSLFQIAVKQLLAVPSSVSICIRFSEPPHSVISCLHTVLQVPVHVVNLTVFPLPSILTSGSCSTSILATNYDVTTMKDERDTYCRYRDIYQNPRTTVSGRHSSASKDSSSFVRRKCDLAEMNRLLSQLAEVSLSLQRTKKECDMIAKRCPPKSSDQLPRKNNSTEENVDGFGVCIGGGVLCCLDERAAVDPTDMEVEKLVHPAQSMIQGTKEQKQGQTTGAGMMGKHELAVCERKVVCGFQGGLLWFCTQADNNIISLYLQYLSFAGLANHNNYVAILEVKPSQTAVQVIS